VAKFAKGHTKLGGRKTGTPNKTAAEIRELACSHAPAAIAELARLMLQAKDERTRVAACNAILDRACGKPTQPLATDDENPFESFMSWIDGKTRGIPSQQEDAQRNLS
jgi:hypothetical protein